MQDNFSAQEILAKVDHTMLKPTATWEDIKRTCEEAVIYSTATVMLPSCYVGAAVKNFGTKIKVASVVGFPHGNMSPAAKLGETARALADGAQEIDMVLNIGSLKAGYISSVTEEIRQLKALCGERILKVIVEACYLTETEKIAACKCVTEGGADFIKTSTGFGAGGATLADVELFKAYIGPKVRIKAAGGLKTREDMEAFLRAGCERLGASSAVKILAPELGRTK